MRLIADAPAKPAVDAADAKAITFVRRDAKSVLVREGWPKVARIGPIDECCGLVTNNGDTVRFDVENGYAIYRPEQQDSRGNWLCSLVDSSFTAPPDDVKP
jgi:hypothetical protein